MLDGVVSDDTFSGFCKAFMGPGAVPTLATDARAMPASTSPPAAVHCLTQAKYTCAGSIPDKMERAEMKARQVALEAQVMLHRTSKTTHSEIGQVSVVRACHLQSGLLLTGCRHQGCGIMQRSLVSLQGFYNAARVVENMDCLADIDEALLSEVCGKVAAECGAAQSTVRTRTAGGDALAGC